MEVPGFAAVGGSGCYSNHIDLIRNDEDEQRLKDIEDNMGVNADDEEAVEEATYELSKNQIDNDDDDDNNRKDEDSSDSSDSDEDKDPDLEQIEEDLQMIDNDDVEE